MQSKTLFLPAAGRISWLDTCTFSSGLMPLARLLCAPSYHCNVASELTLCAKLHVLHVSAVDTCCIHCCNVSHAWQGSAKQPSVAWPLVCMHVSTHSICNIILHRQISSVCIHAYDCMSCVHSMVYKQADTSHLRDVCVGSRSRGVWGWLGNVIAPQPRQTQQDLLL